MKVIRRFSHWLYLFIFLIIGGLFFYYLYRNSEQNEMQARQLKLENKHQQNLEVFEGSIDKFVGLVSGMRSYMNMSQELPSATDFQKFVKNQYRDLRLQDSIVVSFIDTNHVFKQSFTRNSMNPANLVGTSVSSIRSEKKIAALDKLMKHDSIRLFPPLNLVEGWVGLPVNFRVHREGSTMGYVAPIIGFKTILEEIYRDDPNREFVYHFSTEEGFDFDRQRTYNQTEVFNEIEDPEFYKNFNLDASEYLYSTVRLYGFDITIGTAYKNPYVKNKSFISILWFWYLTIAFLMTIVAWQMNRLRELNSRLFQNNALLQRNRKAIQQKNKKLSKLTNTQNKFFSIIGHDIKQPLNAIEGLLSLLHSEEIKDPELRTIISGLTKSTKSTTNLLNNLLRWARSQTGELKYIPSRLDLNRLLEESLETVLHQAHEKSIKLVHHFKDELLYTGDADMLKTLIRNLVSNAIKFTNPGGEIVVESKTHNNFIEISVTDNGIGMTPEEVNSLFVLDKQISTIGTYGEMGTGLGLILCLDFAKKHNGVIEVDSEPNKGSKFTVKLPL